MRVKKKRRNPPPPEGGGYDNRYYKTNYKTYYQYGGASQKLDDLIDNITKSIFGADDMSTENDYSQPGIEKIHTLYGITDALNVFFKDVYDNVIYVFMDKYIKDKLIEFVALFDRIHIKNDTNIKDIVKRLFTDISTKNQSTPGEKYANDIVDQIATNIRSKYKDKELLAGYTKFNANENGNASIKLFKAIYITNGMPNGSLKKFYEENLWVMTTRDNSILEQDLTVGQEMYVRLNEQELSHLASNWDTTPDYDKNKLRFNLLRKDGDIIFARNLPGIVAGTRIWYTKDDDRLGVYEKNAPDDVLKQIYNCYYYDDGTIFTKGRSKSKSKNKDKDFEFNYVKIFKSLLQIFNEQIKKTERARNPDVQPMTFDASEKWIYDSNKKIYYKMVNGHRIEMTDEKMNSATDCYTTKIEYKDVPQCKSIIECIVSSNTSDLKKCIKELENQNIWKVAENDIKNIAPDVMKLILRTFDIKVKHKKDSSGRVISIDGKPIKEIESYNAWFMRFKSNTDNKAIVEALEANESLSKYLKNMIQVIENNPAIINPKIQNIRQNAGPNAGPNPNAGSNAVPNIGSLTPNAFAAPNAPAASNPSGLQRYRNMYGGGGQKSNYINPQVLEVWKNISPALVSNDVLSKYIFNNLATNITFGSVPASPMYGGNQYYTDLLKGTPDYDMLNTYKWASFDMYKRLFDQLYGELKKVGLEISANDDATIKNILGNLFELEDKAADTASILKFLVNFAKQYRLNYADSGQIENIPSEFIQTNPTKEAIEEFMRNHVNKIASNLASNMALQQDIGQNLVYNLMPRMIQPLIQRVQPYGYPQPQVPPVQNQFQQQPLYQPQQWPQQPQQWPQQQRQPQQQPQQQQQQQDELFDILSD